ncbi:MAG: BamA/TamA family outer membrane protein [Synechococcaceae cyanobacterium]|nr:BamA/TamA family outer membrane protein [Synechococcaceae cyanobacterium]
MAAVRYRRAFLQFTPGVLGAATSLPLIALAAVSLPVPRAAASEAQLTAQAGTPAPSAAPASTTPPAGPPASAKPGATSPPAAATPAAPAAPTGQAAPAATPPAGAPAPGQAPAPDGPAPGGDTPGSAADPFLPPGTPSDPAAKPPAGPTVKPAPIPGEPRVLVSEVVIEGLDGHPERSRLEQAAYAAMAVTPGSEVTRSELRNDLSAIYATGWFSDVRIQPKDGPLGVRLVVLVSPNPVLRKVSLDPADAKVPGKVVQDTFAAEYGRTLNLNTLQTRMQDLQKWYADQGYSLARVTGPSRVSPDGDVVLQVRQGTVEGVEVQFLNKEGSATNDKGQPIKGKTKTWVVTREISLKAGQVFNRRDLEEDLKRLYGTGLFSDVKVTLRPVSDDPGRITIVLGIVEQSTGSLSGGLGYSQSQGVFGQLQIQDSNLLGRAWDLSTSFTFGQFGALADLTFTDPWIKGDRFRTAMRIKAFISREAPQIFQSYANALGESYGSIATVSGFYQAPATQVAYNVALLPVATLAYATSLSQALGAAGVSWFEYNGSSVLVQRVGGNIQFVRPLNGGNPFKRASWGIVAGLSAQEVTPMNSAGQTMVYGLPSQSYALNPFEVPISQIICLSYNCATTNQLVGLRLAATYNTLNDPRNPTQGDFFSLSTEQFISVGPNSPNFNRLRTSYTHYIPVNWLRFFKGCRPKPGEAADCKQALAFQVSAGTVIGGLPPYEAFCLGGGNSVRGFYDCNLGVGRSFGEATIEYRFPIFSIISGELFIDAGTTFGSQALVPGNPGGLLGKPGSGFSVGTGLIVTTPVGPLRLEVASQDTDGWRFNLGVGWKF